MVLYANIIKFSDCQMAKNIYICIDKTFFEYDRTGYLVVKPQYQGERKNCQESQCGHRESEISGLYRLVEEHLFGETAVDQEPLREKARNIHSGVD